MAGRVQSFITFLLKFLVMRVENRKARHEYIIFEDYEAGIVLQGQEVKSIREGKVSIANSFCKISGNEVFVVGMHIAHYEKARELLDSRRARKLLLKKTEIKHLGAKISERGFTLVPLTLYFNHRGKAKLKIGLCRGKRQYEKREVLKQRALEREIRSRNIG